MSAVRHKYKGFDDERVAQKAVRNKVVAAVWFT